MTPQQLMDLPYAMDPKDKDEILGLKCSDRYFQIYEHVRSDVKKETPTQ